jgi:hypothetical protein
VHIRQASPASAIVFNLKRLLHLLHGAWRSCLTHIDRSNAVHLNDFPQQQMCVAVPS